MRKIFDYITGIPYTINRWYDSTKCWFRYNFNKKKWNLIKTSIKTYPFDHYYIWDLEKSKLEESLYYFENHYYTERNPDIIKEIKLALKLLNIIIEDGEGLYEWINDEESLKKSYKCNIYVNTNNYHRFVNEKYKEMYLEYQHELYVEKAKYLYYKLLTYKIKNWWD